MTEENNDQRRRTIRLRHYDYSQAGAYFVTVCVANRICLLGEIVDGIMHLNDLGKTVRAEWLETAGMRPQVSLDEYVVMPNHFHAIVIIDDSRRGVLQDAPTSHEGQFRSPSQTIGAIVRGFKSAVTKRINEIRQTPGAAVWQRNYYEHIIRNQAEFSPVREYIVNNPAQWELDRENPHGKRNSRSSTDQPSIDKIEAIFGGVRP